MLIDAIPEFSYVVNAANVQDCVLRYLEYRPIIAGLDDIFVIQELKGITLRYLTEERIQSNDFSALANFTIISALLKNIANSRLEGVEIRLNSLERLNINDFSQYTQAKFVESTGFEEMFIPQSNLSIKSHIQNKLIDPTLKISANNKLKQVEIEGERKGYYMRIFKSLVYLVEKDSLHNSLDKICGLLGYSRWTLNRKLAKENILFKEILKKVRIKKSIYLLAKTDKSIIEIADTLGFSSQSSFNRFIMSNLKTSPGKLRLAS